MTDLESDLRVRAIRVVVFDRDGTLVEDVPYNSDPGAVVARPGAVDAVHRLRARGLKTAVATNQSGIGRGIVTRHEVDAVDARVDDIFGTFDDWAVCPHGPDDGCRCRKPAPGLLLDVAAHLGAGLHEVVVVGDRRADVGAAVAAGATGVLVVSPSTEHDAHLAADHVLASMAQLPALFAAHDVEASR